MLSFNKYYKIMHKIMHKIMQVKIYYYLDAEWKKWSHVLFHVITNNSVHLLNISSKLLLEKESRVFGLNLAHNI